MTPPTDSLEAALRAVPLGSAQLSRTVGDGDGNAITLLITVPAPDYPALAAATREWIKRQMPLAYMDDAARLRNVEGYNAALADVAKALGL